MTSPDISAEDAKEKTFGWRLLLGGITRRVRREGDHWVTQGGEKFHAGFAEHLKADSLSDGTESDSASVNIS